MNAYVFDYLRINNLKLKLKFLCVPTITTQMVLFY